MANIIARLFDFTAGTKAKSQEVDDELSNIIDNGVNPLVTELNTHEAKTVDKTSSDTTKDKHVANNDLKDLQNQITSNDSDISNLQNTDINLQNTDTSLQTQITSNDSDISNLSSNKADKSTTYTKTDVDNKLALKTNLTGDHQGTWQGYTPSNVDQTINNRVGILETEVLTPLYQTILNNGANIFSLPSTAEQAPLQNVVSSGRTDTNLLGSDGNFALDSNADGIADGFNGIKAGATFSVSNNQQVIDTTAGDTGSSRYIEVRNKMELGKYYFASVIIEATGATVSASLRFFDNDHAGGVSSEIVGDGANKRVGVKFQPTNLTSINVAGRCFVNTPQGDISTVKFSQLLLTEITQDEYNNSTVDELLAKYNYINGTQSTQPQRIKNTDGTNIDYAYVDTELQSVPAVADTFDITTGEKTQNVNSKNDIHSQTGWVLNTTQTDVLTFRLSNYIIDAMDNISNINSTLIIGNYSFALNGNLITSNIDLRYTIYNNIMYINIAKTKLSTQDVAGFESWLQAQGSSILTYQLASPITTYLYPQSLLGYPSGTVESEPIVGDYGYYNAGFNITNTNYPIQSLDKLSIIDITTGVETKLDPTLAVIAGDGLSFTHPDIVDGQWIDFDYFYTNETTNSDISVDVATNERASLKAIIEAENQLENKVNKMAKIFSTPDNPIAIKLIDKQGTFGSDMTPYNTTSTTYTVLTTLSNIITESLERRYADLTITYKHGVNLDYIYTTYIQISYQIGTGTEVFLTEQQNTADGGGGGVLYTPMSITLSNLLLTDPVTIRVYAKSDGTIGHDVYVDDLVVNGTTYITN